MLAAYAVMVTCQKAIKGLASFCAHSSHRETILAFPADARSASRCVQVCEAFAALGAARIGNRRVVSALGTNASTFFLIHSSGRLLP